MNDPLSESCPNCHSSHSQFLSEVRDIEYQTSTEPYKYFQCKKCAVVFLSHPPVDKLSIIYPESYYSYSNPRANGSLIKKLVWQLKDYIDTQFIIRTLAKSKKSQLRVLDVGGGSGYTLNLIMANDRRVFESHIIDFDSKAKVIAESNGHIYTNSTVERANITVRFDFVLMLNLIEHVANPEKVLTKIYNNLADGGCVLIKTPNSRSLNFKLFSKSYWGGYHAPRHFVIFNDFNIKDLCTKVGFSTVETTVTQGAPQWAAILYGWRVFKTVIKTGKFPNKRFAGNSNTIILMLAAAFDFTFGRFFGTDQMFVVLYK